jgi:beta-N-acetylhexosaminidase
VNVGQLVITGISGLILTDEEKKFIRDENIGGVILFANNFKDPAQLAELINSIQALRDEYPLFIAIDNEGGRVFRTRSHLTQIPAMLELAKLDSPKIVFEVHSIMAKELKLMGVNLNLAPCADILTNPNNKVIGDRSFGTNAETVEKFVSAAIRGLQVHNMMSCAKHFPGHGGTTKDSHFDLPIVKTTKEEMLQNEILPFIKCSKSRVEFMMMAHLQVDDIDSELPTTLSSKAYEFLREATKFKQIVISDDMEMKAITDRFPTEQAAVMTIEAGADMIEYRSMAEARKGLEGLKEAVKTKKLKNSIIEPKLKRVLDCKERNLKTYNPVYIPDLHKQFNTEEVKKFMKEVTDKIDQLKNQ